ncbi:ABC transporter ATP-binding protein [Aeromicrobium fastidiosum]|uniref:ABC transporter ATP-binding protein n=1 Tax=Aeromicrobium fastidiosum TaxID=52699 RepID=UPI00165F14C7|nr:ABC transporter ATP-binding protein [Aeromicrobium fastidiosum]MBP2389411.1 peptide/nickel transport system ATP-binding protein [Aeromicrobium fastidiosum]
MLSVRDLRVAFPGAEPVVDGISFDLAPRQVLAVAGQSGSGKSLTAMAIMGLLPHRAEVTGSITFAGTELVGASESVLADVRGAEIAMVFQETRSALNPVLTIGKQLVGAIRANSDASASQAREMAGDALREVKILDADRVLESYPHQLSGGMCQRVVIAMALACGSRVLIADEPTTALDVSVQRDILTLLEQLVRDREMSCIFVSHDLGVIDEIADHVAVMHTGQIVEFGPVRQTIADPLHPYTRELLSHLDSLVGEPAPVPVVPDHQASTDPDRGCDWGHEDCDGDTELFTLPGGRQVRSCLYAPQRYAPTPTMQEVTR